VCTPDSAVLSGNERAAQAFDPVRIADTIGIREEDDVSRRISYPAIASRGSSLLLLSDHASTLSAGRLRAVIV
jgi:hypothetical protein